MHDQARLNQEIGHLLHKVVFLINCIANKSLKEGADLTLSQFLVLLSLDKNSNLAMSQQMVANHLGINKAAVSRQVHNLVSSGLVIRNPHPSSQREVRLLLSNEGLRVLRQAQKIMLSKMTPHYNAGGAGIAQALRAMLDSLEKSLD